MYEFNKFIKIKYNKIKPQKGKVLVSEPFSSGEYFNRSIILLLGHSTKESFGIILNKPMNMKLNLFYNNFNSDIKVNKGGPFETDKVFYIHTLGDKIPGSIKIQDNLYWGGNINSIKNEIENNEISSDRIRFFQGSVIWSRKHLNQEIEDDKWMVSSVKTEQVMCKDYENLWDNIVNNLGENFKLWKFFPENPELN